MRSNSPGDTRTIAVGEARQSMIRVSDGAPPTATALLAPEMRRAGVGRSLSTKLLLLTILFVMVAEVLIYVPSIANFRNMWLQEKLDMAAIAALS